MTEQEIKDFFSKDIFATEVGVKIDSVEEGKSIGHLDITEKHLNAGGVCQGGAIFTLADTIMAVAANSVEIGCVSLQSNITFTSAGKLGSRLVCEAEVIAPHHKVPSLFAKIVDNDGRIIATSTAVCFKKQIKQ